MQIDDNTWLVWLADGGRSRPFFVNIYGTDEEVREFLEFFDEFRDMVGDHLYRLDDKDYPKEMLENACKLFSDARQGGGVSLIILSDFERVIE